MAIDFASSYQIARGRFRSAAANASAHCWHFIEPGYGIDGEVLSVDIAEVVPYNARRTLLLTSGTHGIEGYAGSAVQCELLGDVSFLRMLYETRTRLVLAHALNPHGFSRGRRVTAEGVDLNRNAVDFKLPLPCNKDYVVLHPLLVPANWPPSLESEKLLQNILDQMGLLRFQGVISAGQYDIPEGLFFGGHSATWALQAFERLLAKLAQDMQPVIWIDLHTGLGTFGQAECIFTGGGDRFEALALARQLWGQVTQQEDGSAISARLNGSLPSLACRQLGDLLKTSLTWEMGTIPPLGVLQALRADATAYLKKTPNPVALAAAVGLMREAFCPDSAFWCREVLMQGRSVVDAVVMSREWA